MSTAPNPRIGQILMTGHGKPLLEVFVWSDLLDMAVAHVLDMEGGQTGRHVLFAPSSVIRVAQS